MEDNSRFMNSAYVAGEVRDIELGDLGDRKNQRCRVNVHCDGNFVNIQLDNSRNAELNYAEKLFNSLRKGDKIEVRGSLDEFFWNEEYRRSIRPYVSNEKGYGSNIKVFDGEKELEEKATARLAGDIIDREVSYSNDGNLQLDFTMLVWNTYDREDSDNELTRKEVLVNAVQNFGDYAQDNDKKVDFSALKELKEHLEGLDENNVKGILNIYENFKDKFSPILFTIDEFHITAKDNIAEEMEEIDKFDNITVGIWVKNEITIDEFGFAQGSINMLEVGKLVGVNQSLQELEGEEGKGDFDSNW